MARAGAGVVDAGAAGMVMEEEETVDLSVRASTTAAETGGKSLYISGRQT